MLPAIAFASPVAAQAEESPPTTAIDLDGVRDINDLSLEELLDLPVEVASKHAQRTSEAPADVSVVTAEEIALFGYRTLAEILNTQRDFHVTNDHSYEYLGVRGIALPGDYNTRILMLVDGHRANDNVYDSMAVGLDSPIDVSAIERVEIIRGPSSSLYGSNALLGVVNVVTKSGAIEKVRAQAEGGVLGSPVQYDSTRGWVQGGHHLESGLDVFVALSASHRFGVRKLYFPTFDQPETNNGVAVDRDGEDAQNAFLKLGLGNFRFSSGFVRRAKEDPTASFSTIFNDPRQYIVDTRGFADLGYRGHFEAPNLTFCWRATFDYYKYQGYYPEDLTEPGGSPVLAINDDRASSIAWGTEGQAIKHWIERRGLFSKVNTTLGIEFLDRASIKQYNAYQETGEVVLDRNDSSKLLAFLGMQEATFADRVTLGAGLRYDHWVGHAHALSPRITVNATPTSTTRIKLMYGSAFRTANAYERFYDAGYTPNPGLRPEEVDSYELVIVQRLTSRLQLLASAYRLDLQDIIALHTDSSGNLSFQNVASMDAYGASLEVEGAWRFLRFRASYLAQKASLKGPDTASSPLANSPRQIVKGRLLVPLLHERLHLVAEGWYLGQRESVQSLAGYAPPVPSYLQINVGAHFKATRALSLQILLRNLTNNKHLDPASEEFREPSLPQDGFSVWLRLRYDFALASGVI